ncbi:MAG: hypothetical protein VX416_04250 [Pseudomonadota bacterium]|nr:hypothetical protein [Pseudomonadota bacterium]
MDDDRLVKGFICEGAGLSRAKDITEFGEWHAYLEAVANDSKAAKVT